MDRSRKPLSCVTGETERKDMSCNRTAPSVAIGREAKLSVPNPSSPFYKFYNEQVLANE